jgi:hypothetical protein
MQKRSAFIARPSWHTRLNANVREKRTSDATAQPARKPRRTSGIRRRSLNGDVLVPMGGSSLINGRSEQSLAKIKRITDQVAVLIDSERPAADNPIASDRQEFATKCNALSVGDRSENDTDLAANGQWGMKLTPPMSVCFQYGSLIF